MPDEQTIDVLNRLLEAEEDSFISRLGEAAPYVDKSAMAGRTLVERMVADHSSHKRGLVEMILKLRGAPATPRRSIVTGGMHYIDLIHLVPDAIAGARKLVETYESVAGDSSNAEVSTLVARHLEDHRRHLAELEDLHSSQEPPALAGG